MAKTQAPFTMVRRSLWASDRFTSLPDDAARYLYLYFLSCPHQTSSGCFTLKEAYALADLSLPGTDWTPAKYRKVKAAVVASGLVMTDDKTGEILIDRWWKNNSPNNESWFVGARKQCDAIRSTDLRKAAQDALDACWESFTAAKAQETAAKLGRPMVPTGPGGVDYRIQALANRRGAA